MRRRVYIIARAADGNLDAWRFVCLSVAGRGGGDRNGRKVEEGRRVSWKKLLEKREFGRFGALCSVPRYMQKSSKREGRRERGRGVFGLELSRIKDIINGRTRDRHTYVRPECPAINTPVATKLDESEEERGAGV